ncbi:MAG TPA: ATPase, partial [Betaproteobacteria bacterium]|nr:ATPase [Betaproteobacteria bacterium]
AKDTPQATEVYGHILNFAAKLPLREMGVMLVSDMHRAIGQPLFGVPQFSPWANAVADLMLYEM